MLKDWLLEIKKEFGVYFEIIKIDPAELFADETELDWDTKVDALAQWAFHNERNMVPLVVFDSNRIKTKDDFLAILQEG